MKFEEWPEATPNEEMIKEEDGSGVEKQQKIDYLQIAKERGITESNVLELVEKANKQIEIIKPALENLKDKITEIKPDKVMLLSRGADLFLNPLKKYFNDNKISQEIECYNDHDLKTAYFNRKMDEEFIKDNFSQLSTQKIIFVDETFSVGKGALAINEMAHVANAKDIYYFALSQDASKKSIKENLERIPNNKITLEEFEENLQAIKENKNFVLSDCFIDNTLFSKDIGEMVSFEIGKNGKTRTERLPEPKNKNMKEKISNPYEFQKQELIRLEEDRIRPYFLAEKLLEEAIYDALVH